MPRLLDVLPNKSAYLPGEPAQVVVSIENDGPARLDGTLRLELRHLGQLLDTQMVAVNAAPGESIDANTAWTLPSAIGRGYGIDVALLDERGAMVAESSGALDVLERWADAPRYGFLSSFGPEVDAEEIDEKARSLRRFHLTVVQFYDWMWRHYKLLPPQDEFTDALGRPISLPVVRESIAAVHGTGAAAMAYGAVYGAEPEYADRHSEQVLVDQDGNAISLAGLFSIMDISPSSAWTPMIVREFAETVRELDFDGIHLDQYGFPKGIVWTTTGEERDLAIDFPPLIDASRAAVAAERASAGVIFNAVGNWPIETVAPTSQDAIYIEVWPPDVDDNDLRRLIQEGKRLGRGQQVILAAYLTPFLEQPNAPESEAAALLATAAIASSGGFHLLLGERNGILCDPYYPKFATLRDAFIPRSKSYYDYLVRYEEWLTTPDVTDWPLDLGKGVLSAEAMPGRIWAIGRQTATAQIVHLLDLRDQTGTEWNAPRTLWTGTDEPVHIDLAIEEPIAAVWLASPDRDHGRASSIPFVVENGRVQLEVRIAGLWTTLAIERSEV